MTLETFALLSQVVGAVAVIASLIFVGFQIRQQAKATRAQTEQAIAANWMALTQLINDSAEAFNRGLFSKDKAFADLNDDDRMRFLGAMFALFKHYEHMYLQFRERRLREEEWERWSMHVQMYFHQPGAQGWWNLRKGFFSSGFREFLDNSVPPAELSPTALHDAAKRSAAGA